MVSVKTSSSDAGGYSFESHEKWRAKTHFFSLVNPPAVTSPGLLTVGLNVLVHCRAHGNYDSRKLTKRKAGSRWPRAKFWGKSTMKTVAAYADSDTRSMVITGTWVLIRYGNVLITVKPFSEQRINESYFPQGNLSLETCPFFFFRSVQSSVHPHAG